MDLTTLVGKNVLIQFKTNEVWMVVFAPKADEEDGGAIPSPDVMMVNKGVRGDGDPGMPACFPFIQGLLIDATPTVEMDTGSGGKVRTSFSRDVIHSVSVVEAMPVITRIERVPTSSLIQVPAP